MRIGDAPLWDTLAGWSVPKWSVPFLLLLWAGAHAAYGDVVYDRMGGTTKGLVVEEHRDRLVINTEQGERTLLRSEIEEVFYSEPERNYLYLGNEALEEGELSAAEGFFEKALQFNPDLKEAEDALERLRDLQRKAEWAGRTQDPLKELGQSWGLSLRQGEPLTEVENVEAGFALKIGGLAPGDGLAALWGSSLAFLPPARVAQELLGPPNTAVRLTIEREVRLVPAREGEKGWPGIGLSMERLGLTVQLPRGLPFLPGVLMRPDLVAGDRIVRLDGQSTRYLPLAKAREQMERARGRGIRLVIHRDLVLKRP